MNTVYAAFCEATSALLYIGCTGNLAMRIRTHGYGGKCFDWMNTNGPLEFRALCEKRTKKEALRAEARLIRKLRPPLNSRIVGQRKRKKSAGRNLNYRKRIPRDMSLYIVGK